MQRLRRLLREFGELPTGGPTVNERRIPAQVRAHMVSSEKWLKRERPAVSAAFTIDSSGRFQEAKVLATRFAYWRAATFVISNRRVPVLTGRRTVKLMLRYDPSAAERLLTTDW